MIKAEDLFIGAWVSVKGKPVEVVSVTKKTIGYHRDGDKTRLVYARLADVEPLAVENVDFGLDEWVVNGIVRIKKGMIWKWGVAGICQVMGWKLEDIAQINIDKLAARKVSGTIDGNGDNR